MKPSVLVGGAISTFPVKKTGIGLKDLVTSRKEKYNSLLRASYNLIGAVTVKREFSTDDHIWAVNKERRNRKKYRDDANDAKLRGDR